MAVRAIGPLNSKMFLVGEAPGAQEERVGIPFVGSSGKILNGMLRSAGIERSQCRIDNVVNVRPSGNNFNVFYEDKSRRVPSQFLKSQIARLRNEILKVKPNVTIALGAEALRALTGLRYISKWRGSILNTSVGKVVPTFHPASVMRQWSFRPITVFDLKRAREESLTPEYEEQKRDFITAPTLTQVRTEMRRLMRSEYVSFDIETAKGGWPKHIKCIGFADSSTHAICIPFIDKMGGHYWSKQDEAEVWLKVSKLLASHDVKKIAQNAQFDIPVLSSFGVVVNNLYMDTMLMHSCLHPELPRGLDFLCSVYTKRPYYKDMDREDLWVYNCLDVVVTYEVAMVLLKELEEFKTRNFYFRHVLPMVYPLIDIQDKGVRVDMEMRDSFRETLINNIASNQELLDKAVGHKLNVNSPKQMKTFLYEELGLPEKLNRKTGNVTTNEEALNSLAKKFPSKLFNTILAIRRDKKMLATWIDAPVRGSRLRTSYLIDGTLTGRLASRAYIDGTGTDLQNVPSGPARMIIIPEEGNVFVEGDLSQAEARVVAWLADETNQIKAFKSGADVHKYNASIIYKKPVSEVSVKERTLAKRLVHAANYGIGPRGFAAVIGSSESDARDALNKYMVSFPAIELWHLKIQQQLSKTRTLVTPFGRKRHFFARINRTVLKEAYAYIPQSTVADIMHRALVSLYWSLPEGARIALQIHDSLVVECRADQVEDVIKIMKNALEFPIIVNGKELVIPASFAVGKDWNSLKGGK